MCKTTQKLPAQPRPAPKPDRITASCPNACCNTRIPTASSTKRVTFHEEPQIFETIHMSDLTREEIDSMWITDNEWEKMRREFFFAKRKKCPTVEMSQPYRVADRKAIIRYVRLVVKREETKFIHTFRQWQDIASESTNATKPPCWNCYAERLAKICRDATRKSREEAYRAGQRYELIVKAQDAHDMTPMPGVAKPVVIVSPATKRKLLPSITVPAC